MNHFRGKASTQRTQWISVASVFSLYHAIGCTERKPSSSILRGCLPALDSPDFLDAHVSLARLYYRLHMKQEGDHERETVAKLTAEVEAQKRARADEVTKDNGAASH